MTRHAVREFPSLVTPDAVAAGMGRAEHLQRAEALQCEHPCSSIASSPWICTSLLREGAATIQHIWCADFFLLLLYSTTCFPNRFCSLLQNWGFTEIQTSVSSVPSKRLLHAQNPVFSTGKRTCRKRTALQAAIFCNVLYDKMFHSVVSQQIHLSVIQHYCLFGFFNGKWEVPGAGEGAALKSWWPVAVYGRMEALCWAQNLLVGGYPGKSQCKKCHAGSRSREQGALPLSSRAQQPLEHSRRWLQREHGSPWVGKQRASRSWAALKQISSTWGGGNA